MAVKTLAQLKALTQITASDWADLIDSIEGMLAGHLLLAAAKEVKINAVSCLAGQGAAVADISAATVGADLGAFTDPPSAAEMAALRTFVNALKADVADIRTKVLALQASLRTTKVIAT